MRLCFNIDLPDRDLRVGRADMSGRSLRGYPGRESRRFYPLVMCLELLVRVNEWQLARFALEGRRVPLLYQSGVRYQAEPPGEEEWLDIPTLYKQGFGDCEDLGCARAAELRHYWGIPAVCCIKHKLIGPITLVHVQVLHPDGTVEDPSRNLGMKGEYE